ncbi:uncharacterized protein C18orf63 [Cephus cinctus]|uniref:Uncharacterized protein C18orf63 n=1 Tax=Cephus cinctus TaxID=211228 RepID=A0AAJ7VY71_CEPCN|nr:uncharacterized protein C18orf63 [Cephus cinctus]
MDLFINDQELCVELRATRIKKSPVMLEDICLPQNLLIEFMADPEGSIDLKPFGHPWVHVLPSMKRGMVISVSKQIPKACPFKSYDELRRHWKNMHGYRLPKVEEGIIYYEIHFPIAQSNTFTYPNVCLANSLKILRNGKPEIIADRFAQNFMKKITSVCGTRIWINRGRDLLNTKELFLTTNKNIATLQSESNPTWNCASTSSNAVESSVNLTFSDTCANELCRNISGLMSPTQSLRGSITQEAIDIFKTPCLMDANLDSKKIWINDKYLNYRKNESNIDTINNNSSKGNKDLYCQKVLPIYEWESQKVNSVKKLEISSETTNHSQTANQCESQLPRNRQIELNEPITKRILKQSQIDSSQNQMNNLNTIENKQLITYFFKEQKSVQQTTSTSNKREFESFNMASRESRDDSQSQKQSQEMLVDNQSKKRRMEVSRNISIEDLAKQNKLDQLTVPELRNWLKERCIPFKGQDRKSSLIRVIISHVKNTQLLTERLKL